MLRLEELRKKQGLTQEALASKVGVTQGHISGLENETYMPSFDLLIKLAQVLDCSLDELVDMKSNSAAS